LGSGVLNCGKFLFAGFGNVNGDIGAGTVAVCILQAGHVTFWPIFADGTLIVALQFWQAICGIVKNHSWIYGNSISRYNSSAEYPNTYDCQNDLPDQKTIEQPDHSLNAGKFFEHPLFYGWPRGMKHRLRHNGIR